MLNDDKMFAFGIWISKLHFLRNKVFIALNTAYFYRHTMAKTIKGTPCSFIYYYISSYMFSVCVMCNYRSTHSHLQQPTEDTDDKVGKESSEIIQICSDEMNINIQLHLIKQVCTADHSTLTPFFFVRPFTLHLPEP